MRKAFFCLLGVICFIAGWYGLIAFFNIQSYVVPSPHAVVGVFWEEPKLLLDNFVTTLLEVLLGFVLANVVSIAIALLVSVRRGSQHYVLPLAVVLKTIPIIAIAPLLIMWLGSGVAPKVATAALICFFPSLVNMISGVNSINNDYLDLFKLYNASSWQKIRYLYIPYSMPFVFSSLKISSSLAVVGALVGEFLGSNQGIGFLIITNYYSLNTPMVFAAVLLSSTIGVTLYYSLQAIEARVLSWKY